MNLRPIGTEFEIIVPANPEMVNTENPRKLDKRLRYRVVRYVEVEDHGVVRVAEEVRCVAYGFVEAAR